MLIFFFLWKIFSRIICTFLADFRVVSGPNTWLKSIESKYQIRYLSTKALYYVWRIFILDRNFFYTLIGKNPSDKSAIQKASFRNLLIDDSQSFILKKCFFFLKKCVCPSSAFKKSTHFCRDHPNYKTGTSPYGCCGAREIFHLCFFSWKKN